MQLVARMRVETQEGTGAGFPKKKVLLTPLLYKYQLVIKFYFYIYTKTYVSFYSYASLYLCSKAIFFEFKLIF